MITEVELYPRANTLQQWLYGQGVRMSKLGARPHHILHSRVRPTLPSFRRLLYQCITVSAINPTTLAQHLDQSKLATLTCLQR